MNREEAADLVKKHVSNKNLRKHMYASEAVMKRIARELGEDTELWGLAGLLHDLDYDETVDNFSQHGIRTAEILADKDLPDEVIQAIKSHPGHFPRKSLMDKALYAADPITGLIVAATLMHPDKKIKKMDAAFVKRRFKDKRFAAGADRDQINSCEKLGFSIEKFIQLSLSAMQTIDDQLGL